MRPLSALELLDVWERGRTQPPVQRALLLLAAACPDETAEALAALPLGRRDARLLRLRAWTLGPRFGSVATCPACGEALEFSFAVDDVLVASDATPPETLSIRSDGYEVTFRLPNSLDVAEAGAHDGEDAGRLRLLRRCLVQARYEHEDVSADRLPETVVAAIAGGMAQADPQADLRIDLSCPACAHTWQSAFDAASYFWSELEDWAARTLRDVHTLAATYGWREADILAMSAWRRQQYLEMANR